MVVCRRREGRQARDGQPGNTEDRWRATMLAPADALVRPDASMGGSAAADGSVAAARSPALRTAPRCPEGVRSVRERAITAAAPG